MGLATRSYDIAILYEALGVRHIDIPKETVIPCSLQACYISDELIIKSALAPSPEHFQLCRNLHSSGQKARAGALSYGLPSCHKVNSITDRIREIAPQLSKS